MKAQPHREMTTRLRSPLFALSLSLCPVLSISLSFSHSLSLSLFYSLFMQFLVFYRSSSRDSIQSRPAKQNYLPSKQRFSCVPFPHSLSNSELPPTPLHLIPLALQDGKLCPTKLLYTHTHTRAHRYRHRVLPSPPYFPFVVAFKCCQGAAHQAFSIFHCHCHLPEAFLSAQKICGIYKIFIVTTFFMLTG